MARSKIKVGTIKDISGEVNIAGGNIGYTAKQVSVLLREITSTFQPKPFDGRCPYKGLDVFEEEDAGLFFGREELVDDLVGRVKASRTVFITGPSGSGKSSLVRAGLIPALKNGAMKNSERWLYETMKPTREPFIELARVASSLTGTLSAGEDIRTKGLSDARIMAQWSEIALKDQREKRAVIFIDQFEEVFTQIAKEEERMAFLNLLTHTATVEKGRAILLFAMRSDFVSNCATYPGLNALLNQQFVQIGAMRPDELVSAIAQPALRVGLRVDPDLIAQIINDMQGEPGALPLMQFALKDLFDAEQAKGGVIALTLDEYVQRGGIHKSLERHADEAFAKLSENEQELAYSIFGRLIEIGRGTQDTRRTALFDELIPADARDIDVEAVVQKLADARLLTTDEQAGRDTVTISHEKLIDAWPWLKKLVNENRDVISLQNEIATDAKEWDSHNRDASYLYIGARLDYAREQLETKKLILSASTQEFVQAGHIRQRRGRGFLIAGISTIIGLLVIAVFVFSRQANENKKLAQQARLRELAAQAALLRDRNLQTSLLLGLEVFSRWDIPQTRGVLLDNVQSDPQLQQFLSGHSDSVNSVAFSPNGKILASGSADGTILLWDTETHRPIGEPLTGHTDLIMSIAFSPDGKTLASGSYDNTIILWDVETHQPIGQPLTKHSGTVYSVTFSPDGGILASASADKSIILWDMKTYKTIEQPLTGHTSRINSVIFSPDGKTIVSASADKTIIFWDVETHQSIGQMLSGHSGSIYSVVFSPNGKMLASGSDDTSIILWDVKTHQSIGRLLAENPSRVNSLAFSPDGETLASGRADNSVILWDMKIQRPIGLPFTGHSGPVNAVAFSADGKTLASGSDDNTVILWDMEIHHPISHSLTGHSVSVYSVAFDPDGRILASGDSDNSIILWNMETYRPIGQPLKQHAGRINSVAFSPNGKVLASGSADNTIILWDVETHQSIGPPLMGHTNWVTSVAFSPNGKVLASGSADGTITLWSMETYHPINKPLIGHTNWVTSVAFSPDGRTLASGSADHTIILWAVETHQSIGPPLMGHTNWVTSVAFSPNGKVLASGSYDNTIILWDVETHQSTGQPLTGHSALITSLTFSPDGRTLASGSADNTIILWAVETNQPIGRPLSGYSSLIHSIAFDPDGKMLASASASNTVILWDLNPQSWILKTCQRAGRNFTRAEWARYFPNEEYHKTCEQWALEPQTASSLSTTP